MNSNITTVSRIVRVGLAIVIVLLFTTKIVSGTFGIILLVFGAIFFLTAAMNFCPMVKVCPANRFGRFMGKKM